MFSEIIKLLLFAIIAVGAGIFLLSIELPDLFGSHQQVLELAGRVPIVIWGAGLIYMAAVLLIRKYYNAVVITVSVYMGLIVLVLLARLYLAEGNISGVHWSYYILLIVSVVTVFQFARHHKMELK